MTNTGKNDFPAYIEAVLSQDNDADVLNDLMTLEVPISFRIRVKVLYSAHSPSTVVDSFVRQNLLEKLNGTSHSYVYEVITGGKNAIKLRVPFFIASLESYKISQRVQAIISVCTTDQWKALKSFIRTNYPKLVPILLSQKELIVASKNLKQTIGHSVHVQSFSAKERLNQSGRKRVKSVREWTDEELDRALAAIQDRSQTITSLDVDFYHRVGAVSHVLPKAVCKIRKEGEIEVTGSLRLAFEAVAVQVAKAGEEKLQLFSGRSLQASQYKPRPLSINFKRMAFEKIESIRSFVDVLRKYPHSIHAVEHGNPYAHVKVTDMFDGSCFDIWAVPPQRIALIPGLKASEGAFERIVHYIFERFHEGDIAEYA